MKSGAVGRVGMHPCRMASAQSLYMGADCACLSAGATGILTSVAPRQVKPVGEGSGERASRRAAAHSAARRSADTRENDAPATLRPRGAVPGIRSSYLGVTPGSQR